MRPHERRSEPAGRGPLLAGLVISCLMVGTASSWTQRSQEELDYPHAYPREGVTKRFENERVIVWEVVWPDGVPAEYHRHREVVVTGAPRAFLFELRD